MNRGTEICRILQMFSGMSLVQNLRANLIRKGFNFARKTDMSNFLTKKKKSKAENCYNNHSLQLSVKTLVF